MVEILFGESEAGAMKIALKSEKELGRDCVCLPLMLDVGDIQQPVLGKYRRDLLYRMLYREQWGADKQMKTELKALGGKYAQQIGKLNDYIKNRESLRIWYCDAPYSMCGFMWLCSRLKRYKGELWAVRLPRVEVRNEGMSDEYGVFRANWGEVEPREFTESLPLQRRLSRIEIMMNGVNWEALVSEDAPLRAVVNGGLISVPTSFYDFLIWKKFRMYEKFGEEFKRQAEIIGSILAEEQGIGDWWYAYRIDKLIKKGRIEVVEDSDKKYERMLRMTRL